MPLVNHPKNAIFVTINEEYLNYFNTIPHMEANPCTEYNGSISKTFRVSLPEFSLAMPMTHFTKRPMTAMLFLWSHWKSIRFLPEVIWMTVESFKWIGGSSCDGGHLENKMVTVETFALRSCFLEPKMKVTKWSYVQALSIRKKKYIKKLKNCYFPR